MASSARVAAERFRRLAMFRRPRLGVRIDRGFVALGARGRAFINRFIFIILMAVKTKQRGGFFCLGRSYPPMLATPAGSMRYFRPMAVITKGLAMASAAKTAVLLG